MNISNNEKYYRDYKHYPFILDLIEKGILVLTLNLNTVNKKAKRTLPDMKGQQGIVEMETKTTPTCLTSYLKQ